MTVSRHHFFSVFRFVVWTVLCVVLVAACSFLAKVNLAPTSVDGSAHPANKTLLLQLNDAGDVIGVIDNGNTPSAEELRTLQGRTTITRIDLAGASLDDAIMAALPNVSGLRILTLSSSNVNDRQLLNLDSMPLLAELRLNDTHQLREGLLCLAPLPQLQQIDLTGCTWLTDDHLQFLVDSPLLTSINLSHTAVTDKGLACLRELPLLRQVMLVGCPRVTEETLEYLADHKSLAQIKMPGSGLTLSAVSEFLDRHPTVTLLAPPTDFRDMTQIGEAARRFSEACADISPDDPSVNELSSLRVSPFGNSIREVGELSLYDDSGIDFSPVQYFNHVLTLNLIGSGVDDQDLQFVRGMSGLRSLRLRKTRVTDVGIQSLDQMSELVSIDLSDTSVSDASLAVIAQSAKLKSLQLARTRVTDAGVHQLRELKELETVDLAETAITNDSIETLNSLAKLSFLRLAGTAVSDAGINQLAAESAGQLRRIDLSRTQVTGKSLIRLLTLAGSDRSRYLELQFAGTKTCDQDFESFADSDTAVAAVDVAMLDLSDTSLSGRAFSRLRDWKIWNLKLRNAPLTSEGIAAICDVPGILSIDLRGVSLSPEHALNLGDSGVRSLVLDGNLEFLNAMALTPLADRMTSLTLSDINAEMIQSLTKFRQLKTLVLEDSEADQACFDALGEITQLNLLSLVRCHVDPETRILTELARIQRQIQFFRTPITDSQLTDMRQRDPNLNVIVSRSDPTW